MSRDRIDAPMLETRRRGTDEWPVDPTEWSLDQSTMHRERHAAFCPEVGRRMLLAQLEFSKWILRRVEKVAFDRDRSVSRTTTFDLRIRDDAPVFRSDDGEAYWLVPIASMRRRTLVSLHIWDEDDRPVTLPGIRLTQQLDEAMLLAAAALTPAETTEQREQVRDFVRQVIAGRLNEVIDAVHRYRADGVDRPDYLVALADNEAFDAALTRLQRSFTLYLFLPVSAGRHRLLRMHFDEPTDWRYRRSTLREDADGVWHYKAARDLVKWYEPTHILTAFALKSIRLRLQVPAADRAASYHFEIVAPPGLRIVKAALVAGRPNVSTGPVSEDHVVGHAPTVGLHAVEVPNGSLCRVQVDLRVPTRGWLTTMLVSCLTIFGVLLSVMAHWTYWRLRWGDIQVINVCLLLVTTSAGVAALISQREFGGVAARMLGRLRTLGAISTSLPIFAAGFLAYATYPADGPQMTLERRAIGTLTVIALLVLAVALAAYLGSRHTGHLSVIQESPWDMTEDTPARAKAAKAVELRAEESLHTVLAEYGFDSPAVAIRSAEGWHERYAWSDELQQTVVDSLVALGEQAGSGRHFAACTMAGQPCPGEHASPAQRLIRTNTRIPMARVSTALANASRMIVPTGRTDARPKLR